MKSAIKKGTLTIFAITALLCFLFWHEIAAKLRYSLSSAFLGVAPACSSEVIINGRYLPLTDNIHNIAISELRANKLTTQSIDISFLLINKGGDNAYPALRVYLFDKSGKATRSLDFRHDQYSHGTKFTKESINLRMPLMMGESAFDIKPFYPG